MSDAVKRRVAARGWVTRACKRLTELVSTKEVDIDVLQDAIEQFDKRLISLDEVQTAVEYELSEGELESDICESADFREEARVTRIKACKLLSVHSTSSTQVQDCASPRSTSIEAKLPKLQLPTFGGELTEWPSFWEQFEAVVDDSELADISKFSYLLSLLRGEAKAAVQGLSLTAGHYRNACQLLKERFGRPERIIFLHVQQLLNISLPKQPSVAVLWNLYNDLQKHIRSLEALGISGEQYGVLLTPIILSCLPSDLRMEWARVGEHHESDLEFLLEFLQHEIERRERSQTFSKEHFTESKPVSESRRCQRGVHTTSALHTSQEKSTKCVLCGRAGHSLSKCYDISNVSVGERKPILRSVGACYKCLSIDKKHVYRNCNAQCVKCKGKHHVLLCDCTQMNQPVTDNRSDDVFTNVINTSGVHSNAVSNVNSVKGASSHVLLQTARVNVVGNKGRTSAVVLFDTGSDKTYISESLVRKIGPEWVGSQNLAYAAFGNEHISSAEQRNVYSVQMQGTKGDVVKLMVTEIPVICAPMYRPSVPHSVLTSFGKDIELVDVPAGSDVTVDILVGLDTYWKLMSPEIIFLPDGLVVQQSVFGWILSGPLSVPTVGSTEVNISHQLFCSNFSESGFKNFWDLESVGIIDREPHEVDPVLDEFTKDIQFSEGRYVVSLPWKSESVRPKLLNNEKMARHRLENLTRRQVKDPDLESKYHKVFHDMLVEGIIEEVTDDGAPAEEVGFHPIYYMPHRPVIKESSLTTKIRPVFDASAKGFNGVSLNDCLETGPSLIPDLPGILLRFRRWKVALTADVTKAFHQIQVCHDDQDVHRFLWNDKGVIRTMRFVRVPFGNKSSPFLLNATIKHHLSKFPSTLVVNELSENLYVDDWLTGCDEESDGCAMLKEAQNIMYQAGMTLAKWGSNSEQVGELLQREFQDKYVEEESVKVLGMRWLPSEDCFTFDGLAVADDLCVTKRVVLSFIARLFDPLGLLTPFIIGAKCLFQELWREGLGWDELVPEEVQQRFGRWISDLQCLHGWKIRRSYFGIRWREVVVIQLHAFGDASESAYGACVYLRVRSLSDLWFTSLMLSRAKVAPLKKLTLPRLELMGALLCARLLVFVRKALKLSNDVTYHCWTDSTVTLAWIKSDPYKWKPFVCNRVSEIQKITDTSQWHHCPGKDNPADLVTRGVSVHDLMQSDLWLGGPTFLRDEVSEVFDVSSGDERVGQSSLALHQIPGNIEQDELCQPTVVLVSGLVDDFVEITRWSTLSKALRIVAWVLRFCHNVRISKEERVLGYPSFEEIEKARIKLLCYLQQLEFGKEIRALREGRSLPKGSSLSRLSPFLQDDLLRVQGRIQFSSLPYDSRHPIIVSKGHFALLLARHAHQVMKHAGVNSMLVMLRNQYWIIGGRRMCKQVKRECLSCQRMDAPHGKEEVAPLPELRVAQASPFSVTGMDHAGPLFCRDFVGKKFYILLFTCAVIRAVHLELVESLSSETTVLALRRFISRRGMPSILMSDNAKGFKAAKEQMLKLFGSEGPEWKFIAPHAPWWGGWWERLVRSIKSALRKSVPRHSLSRVELESTLHEVEACVNSRPLTFVGDELDSGSPLTPSHFLIGRSVGSKAKVGSEVPVISRLDLTLRQERYNQVIDTFWTCWLTEYIRNLPVYKGSKVQKGNIHEGSVVIVQDHRYSRLHWPIGIVQKVYPGRDGHIRTVEVRTSKGVYIRPIQRVYDLEISDPAEGLLPVSVGHISDESLRLSKSKGTSDGENPSNKYSRFGRLVKKPSRLGEE